MRGFHFGVTDFLFRVFLVMAAVGGGEVFDADESDKPDERPTGGDGIQAEELANC